MKLFDRIRGIFKTEVEVKATEDIGAVLAPIFREIPPATKAGEYLKEGAKSWAYIAMSAIADEISTTEITLYGRKGKDWIEKEEHQILNLLDKPNPVQTGTELKWLLAMFWMAEGEAPLLLNNSANPTEVVLLNPSRLKIEYDNQSLITSYKYRQSNNTERIIPAELIIFLKQPSFETPFRGMGCLRYIAQTLDLDNYIEEYLRMFFFNDATPGSVLETDKELSKSIIDRLRTQLRIRHQGYKKAHKNMILEGGLKWVNISSKMNELQLKDLSDQIRDKILAAFKVPKSVVGIVEDVNRANSQMSDYTFSKRCISPKLAMLEAQLNNFLVPKFSDGQNLWLEFENPVKEDEEIQARIDEIYVKNGILTVNEIRARMEIEPLKGGDEPRQPVQGFGGLGSLGLRKYPKPWLINKRKKSEVKREKKIEIKTNGRFVELMKDFLRKQEPKKTFTPEEKEKFHKDKIMFIEPLENEYKEKLKAYFRRQGNEVLGQVKGIKIDEEKEANLIAEISIPFISEVIEKESELAFALLGFRGRKIDPQDKLARNFIERRTLKLGKSASSTTRDAVEDILRRWTEEEGTTADLRSMLRDYFGRAEINRVDMIARTELSRAAGFAQVEVYKQTGAVGKQWLTAGDEMVCFPAGIKISVKNGEKNIEKIKMGDLIKTPQGFRKVKAIMSREYKEEFIAIKAGNNKVASTNNHPFYVNGKWKRADNLILGDIIQTVDNKLIKIDGICHFKISDADSAPTILLQQGIPFDVISLVMPISSISFNNNFIERKSKICRVFSYLKFLNKIYIYSLQTFFDNFFKGSFSLVFSKTRKAAKSSRLSTLTQRTGNSKFLSAIITDSKNWRSSASFRTKMAVKSFFSNKSLPAPFTRLIFGKSKSARNTANSITIGDTFFDSKSLSTNRAKFGYKDSFFSKFIALLTAKPLIFATQKWAEFNGAKFAFLSERFISSSPSVHMSNYNTNNHKLSTRVYNFEVEKENVYFANNILVHNCEWCGEMDGKMSLVADNFWDKGDTMVGSEGGRLDLDFEGVGSPPLHPDCRCDLIPVYEESLVVGDYKVKNKAKLQKIIETEKKEANLKKKELDLVSKESELIKKEEDIDKAINELNELHGENKEN